MFKCPNSVHGRAQPGEVEGTKGEFDRSSKSLAGQIRSIHPAREIADLTAAPVAVSHQRFSMLYFYPRRRMEMPKTPSPFATPFVSSHPSTSSHKAESTSRESSSSFFVFPLEIWLQILDFACTDDGTTSLSLSRTSRTVREFSRFHRYRSVVLEGWESAIRFEQAYCSSSNLNKSLRSDGIVERMDAEVEESGNAKGKMKDEEEQMKENADEDERVKGFLPISDIVNLYVHIPELYNAAYPPESWFPDIDSDEDSSYAPSHSEDEGDQSTDESTDEDDHDTSTEGRPATGSTDLCQGERSEVDHEETSSNSSSNPSLAEEPGDYRHLESRTIDGQTLSHLLDEPVNRLSVFEHKVFSALRRILLLSSSSLQVFALCFQTHSSFHLEALIPRLEKLRWLSVFRDTVEEPSHLDVPRTFSSFRINLHRREELSEARGCLWPNLEHLTINSRDNHVDTIVVRGVDKRAWKRDAFDGLLVGANKLTVVYAPRYMIRYLSPLPESIISVHAFLGHRDIYTRISIPVDASAPAAQGPVATAGGATLSLPTSYPGQSANANSPTNNSNAGTQHTANDRSKGDDTDKNFALTDGEITFLLYRRVQYMRSASAVYYRVPEPSELESSTSMGAEDEGADGKGNGEGKGEETEAETEQEKERGKGTAKEKGKAKSTNEPAWVKEEWLRAVEHGW
ncbi:hypothetical protein EST38_g4916 [Candolleomyces aberdarensis]|uniref:F-box domain-containing protein n=1 Tax=Candolleomyces aberdarensis TaxID=2316362 RepID=A0A4Q2DNL0_9AGAR|nr:hypothetical protein EST38_g4916 [Candolleomyces aberdarensis]